MPRWVAIFEDEPTADWVRRKHDREHFDYLAAHRDKIRLAGGLRADPGQWFCGGLWILDVEDRATAVRLCEDDPYFRLGLRKGYRLMVWGRAPIYEDVTL
jgi:uncharacterized protein YciI